jgi:hypothetical protein
MLPLRSSTKKKEIIAVNPESGKIGSMAAIRGDKPWRYRTVTL